MFFFFGTWTLKWLKKSKNQSVFLHKFTNLSNLKWILFLLFNFSCFWAQLRDSTTWKATGCNKSSCYTHESLTVYQLSRTCDNFCPTGLNLTAKDVVNPVNWASKFILWIFFFSMKACGTWHMRFRSIFSTIQSAFTCKIGKYRKCKKKIFSFLSKECDELQRNNQHIPVSWNSNLVSFLNVLMKQKLIFCIL